MNILFCERRSTGFPSIDILKFVSVRDDAGVWCAVLRAVYPTQKQYESRFLREFQFPRVILNRIGTFVHGILMNIALTTDNFGHCGDFFWC